MTPKEKAKELVDKFTVVGLQQRNEGIQCAVIAVDEIIYAYPHTYDMEKDSTKDGKDIYIIMNVRSNIEYWNEVKKEIENYDTKNI
jgi:hypothetical protein